MNNGLVHFGPKELGHWSLVIGWSSISRVTSGIPFEIVPNSREFLPEMLDRYEKEWKQERNFKHIAPEMAIPDAAMN